MTWPATAAHDEVPTFVTICAACGEVLDINEDRISWNQSVLWGYVADLAHRQVCPKRGEGNGNL